MRIVNPKEHAEVSRYCEMIRMGETLVVNIESVENSEAQRILDIMSGVILALDGASERSGDKMYIFAPRGIKITNELRTKAMSKVEGERIRKIMGRR
jgi:cell division inhibitor SepF